MKAKCIIGRNLTEEAKIKELLSEEPSMVMHGDGKGFCSNTYIKSDGQKVKVTHFKDGAVIVNPTDVEMYIHTK